MQRMLIAIGRLVARDDGQDLLEYGFLAALIAIVVMASLATVGNQVSNVLWSAVASLV